MRYELAIKFDNYETTSTMVAKLQMQCEDILKEIVEEIMNGNKIPYISFNDESGYVNFFDESIGETSSIIGIRVVELNGEKTLQIANSDYSVDDLTDNEVWFNPNLYGDFSSDEMVSLLMSMFGGE
jgi:Mg2+/Co2+ transporter CorC